MGDARRMFAGVLLIACGGAGYFLWESGDPIVDFLRGSNPPVEVRAEAGADRRPSAESWIGGGRWWREALSRVMIVLGLILLAWRRFTIP